MYKVIIRNDNEEIVIGDVDEWEIDTNGEHTTIAMSDSDGNDMGIIILTSKQFAFILDEDTKICKS